MMRSFRKSPLRGGIYHLCLILIVLSSFNFGFLLLTGVDIAGRVFAGSTLPIQGYALGLCVSSVIVLWNNWID